MTVSRKPWERRLEDLSHLLKACNATYFDPELMRRNTNQFLQTARTVTFIIQKNKGNIPHFDDWYREHALDKWTHDNVMTWAKNARNTIEKEGDLELNSTLDVSLIFSYLEEEDAKVQCGRSELLNAGVKKLVRFARKQLPTGIQDAAGIRIERNWKTSKLESHELLQALGYVYARLFECCDNLAKHLGGQIPKSIPEPSELSVLREVARHVQLVKLRDMQTYHFRSNRMYRGSEEDVPKEFKENVRSLKESLSKPTDFQTSLNFFSRMAEATFTQWGNHVPMLFLLNDDWSIQYQATSMLLDQTDKYFFWRMIAERIAVEKPHCLVHTCEVWVRDLSKHRPGLAIRELPIKGERLQLCAFDRDGNWTVITWPIEHGKSEELPTLGEAEEAEESDKRVFFLIPAMRSMGIEPNFVPDARATVG